MKAIGACLGLGLLVLIWVAATGAGCTTGNRDGSVMASRGESCEVKTCAAPSRCIDVSEPKPHRECHITCSGSGLPGSRTDCPRGMVCAVPTFATSYICIEDPDRPFLR